MSFELLIIICWTNISIELYLYLYLFVGVEWPLNINKWFTDLVKFNRFLKLVISRTQQTYITYIHLEHDVHQSIYIFHSFRSLYYFLLPENRDGENLVRDIWTSVPHRSCIRSTYWKMNSFNLKETHLECLKILGYSFSSPCNIFLSVGRKWTHIFFNTLFAVGFCTTDKRWINIVSSAML